MSDALVNVEQTAATATDLQASVDAARNALRLATRRYEAGYAAYLNVLDAQRTLNITELALIRNRQALLSASVDLMKALGGEVARTPPSSACAGARRRGNISFGFDLDHAGPSRPVRHR